MPRIRKGDTVTRTPSLIAAASFLSAVLPVPPAAADSVRLTMTKTHVAAGETVEFTITNHRDETVWLNGFPYWTCWEMPSGAHGGPCVGVPTLYPLAAGQWETQTWSQLDCITGLPVPLGLYSVRVSWSSPSEPLFQDEEAFFCIGDDPACGAATGVEEGVEAMAWGRVRALYR